MEEITTYNASQTQLYDPTRTTTLRNAFARVMKQRFAELIKVVKTSVATNDCLALNKPTTLQMTPAARRAFEFRRTDQKIEAFMSWLQEQIDRGILQIGVLQQIGDSVERSWLNLYILDSYKRGIIRARSEMIKAGLIVQTIEASGGIQAVLNGPFHVDRVGILFTRTFNELKGITDAMDAQISRILAQGIIDGDGAELLARKLVAVINGDGVDRLGITDALGRFIPAERRAMLLARTEIIRAHHLATIQEYRNWGLEGVKVKAEWATAGDGRVCPHCESLEGKVFTLDQIENMIPAHPACRCIALPFIEDIEKYLK